jgi:cytochrome c-type biogenesis protein CcmH/NrfG
MDRKAQIEAMLANDPTDTMLRYMLGMEYVSSGEDESAVTQFTLLMDATPPYVPAFHMAGQALARLGREADAAQALRRGVGVAQTQGDAHAAGEMASLLATLE